MKKFGLNNENPISLVFVEADGGLYNIDVTLAGDYWTPAGVQLVDYDTQRQLFVSQERCEILADSPVDCWVVDENKFSTKAQEFFRLALAEDAGEIFECPDDCEPIYVVGVLNIDLDKFAPFMARPSVAKSLASVMKALPIPTKKRPGGRPRPGERFIDKK